MVSSERREPAKSSIFRGWEGVQLALKKFTPVILFFLLITSQAFSQAPVLLIVGTRPEVIKMIPVYQALKNENIPTILCATGQHAELADSALALFEVKPDYELKIMKQGQDLFYITEAVLEKTKALFLELKPALVVVQGDTTSAMSAALAAFYLKIPIAHVEAGLRSGNMQGPFPEEMNRRFISLVASYHFAPTAAAASHLIEEGVKKETVFCTGNTVVDALFKIKDRIEKKKLIPSSSLVEIIQNQRVLEHRILLLTAHRRESFDGGIQSILAAMKTALERYPNLHIIYPRHPNPLIEQILREIKLDSMPNISILPPLAYQDVVYLLSNVDGVATDSGGIQEEAASLSKPILVLRNETDRPEALGTTAILVGVKQENILMEIDKLMKHDFACSIDPSVYGDGRASQRIAKIIKELIKKNDAKKIKTS